MMLPTVSAQGRLAADPELRFTAAGKAVVTFTIACSERGKNEAGEWVDKSVTWLDVTAWERQAEEITENLHKGDLVMVDGLLTQSSWEKDGVKRTKHALRLRAYAITPRRQQNGPQATSSPSEPDAWAQPNVPAPF